MSTLALVTGPKPDTPANENLLVKLALRVRAWFGEQIRYRRALHQLRQLNDRDLDDINVARADFPGLARRHAATAG